MRIRQLTSKVDGLADLDRSQTEVLTPSVERSMLQELAECKGKLAQALANLEGIEIPQAGDQPQALALYIAHMYSGRGPEQVRLGAVYRRYSELRGQLAMANMKLVAHVAKRFRERGIPYSDLMQEGFCGLLEAIDRFNLHHQTKLATYATWWIRQAMQRAVASGAYPVRLTPRHLRQLAQAQEQKERQESTSDSPTADETDVPSSVLIHFIHAATRPSVSFDATRHANANFNLLQTISDPEGDRTAQIDTDETVGRLMEVLRPREQQVLIFRFGLGGGERLSLSQVGRILGVSKERVRQIEDRSLEKLRARADEQKLAQQFPWSD
jgi:RNA polymerase primary sigma factor